MRKIAIAFLLTSATLIGQELSENEDAGGSATVSSPKSNFCANNLSLEESIKCEIKFGENNSNKTMAIAQDEDNVLKVVNKSKDLLIKTLIGKASHYGQGDGFHGKKTASGAIFNKNDLTCAVPYKQGSKTPKYPFGTKLKVINNETGKSVVVTVSDTGNFGHKGRVVDLSYGAFKAIADPQKGLVNVSIIKL